MESFAVFPEGEFDSFNRSFANIDQLDFTHQLHMFPFPLENDEGFNPSNFCHNPEPDMSRFNENVDWFPPTFPSIAMEDRTLTVISKSSYQNTKRPRVSNHAPSPKMNVNANGGDSNIGSDSRSCSRRSSLEDDNVSQDTNNRKRRASRVLATDPQSTYARKRRERINERLRILQNLVPNGTKVDVSTMLEEAVEYVKFLQLQIKLLSSDDLWMYAPIAYNGIDAGLDKKISKLLDMDPGRS